MKQALETLLRLLRIRPGLTEVEHKRRAWGNKA